MTLAQQVSAAKERVVEAAKRVETFSPFDPQTGWPGGFIRASNDLNDTVRALFALESETCTDCAGRGIEPRDCGEPNCTCGIPCPACAGSGRRERGTRDEAR